MNPHRPLGERREEANWLRSLRDRAQEWLKVNDGLRGWVEGRGRKGGRVMKPVPIPTDAYVDLIFAFGLARLGAQHESRELMSQAGAVQSDSGDALHAFAYRAFAYRITEALAGRPLTGLLSAELIEELKRLEKRFRYLADRLRKHSRILEPDQRINPYGSFYVSADPISLGLFQLSDLSDRTEIAQRIRDLFAEASAQKAGAEVRSELVSKALEISLQMDEAFATAMLDRALAVCDALSALDALPSEREEAQRYKMMLLGQSLATATFFERQEFISPLIDRIQTLLRTLPRQNNCPPLVEPMAAQCFRSLRKWDLREQIDQLLLCLWELVLGGKDVNDVVKEIDFKNDLPSPLNVLLLVAGGRYYLGRDREAESILEPIRSILFEAAFPPWEQKSLACAYVRAVGQMQALEARDRLEELFEALRGVDDTYSSQSHFKAAMLEVIESVVLAVVERSQPLTVREPDALLAGRRDHRPAPVR